MSVPGNDTHTGTSKPAMTISKFVNKRTAWAMVPMANSAPQGVGGRFLHGGSPLRGFATASHLTRGHFYNFAPKASNIP